MKEKEHQEKEEGVKKTEAEEEDINSEEQAEMSMGREKEEMRNEQENENKRKRDTEDEEAGNKAVNVKDGGEEELFNVLGNNLISVSNTKGKKDCTFIYPGSYKHICQDISKNKIKVKALVTKFEAHADIKTPRMFNFGQGASDLHDMKNLVGSPSKRLKMSASQKSSLPPYPPPPPSPARLASTGARASPSSSSPTRRGSQSLTRSTGARWRGHTQNTPAICDRKEGSRGTAWPARIPPGGTSKEYPPPPGAKLGQLGVRGEDRKTGWQGRVHSWQSWQPNSSSLSTGPPRSPPRSGRSSPPCSGRPSLSTEPRSIKSSTRTALPRCTALPPPQNTGPKLASTAPPPPPPASPGPSPSSPSSQWPERSPDHP